MLTLPFKGSEWDWRFFIKRDRCNIVGCPDGSTLHFMEVYPSLLEGTEGH